MQTDAIDRDRITALEAENDSLRMKLDAARMSLAALRAVMAREMAKLAAGDA
jgi:hypothetical protein